MRLSLDSSEALAIRPEIKAEIRKILGHVGAVHHVVQKGLTLSISGNSTRGWSWHGHVMTPTDCADKRRGYLEVGLASDLVPGVAPARIEEESTKLRADAAEAFRAAGWDVKPLSGRRLIMRPGGPPPAEPEGAHGYKVEALPAGVWKTLTATPVLNERLEKNGCTQICYGPEFITSSYAVARDDGDLRALIWHRSHKGMSVYDTGYDLRRCTPDDLIRFDPELKLFWLPTGSFD